MHRHPGVRRRAVFRQFAGGDLCDAAAHAGQVAPVAPLTDPVHEGVARLEGDLDARGRGRAPAAGGQAGADIAARLLRRPTPQFDRLRHVDHRAAAAAARRPSATETTTLPRTHASVNRDTGERRTQSSVNRER